jgi:antitoxin component of MazEF toxin-antitoxin module
MPKLIRLNKFGTLAITIPKSIALSTKLKAGDDITMELKSVEPVIIALRKNEPVKW